MSQTFAAPTEAEIRAEEATMLRERAMGSARSVLLLIGLIAISLASVQLYQEAIAWFVLASAMVGVTVVYARLPRRLGETPGQVDRYLQGHVLISACTGSLWTIGALQLASSDSELQTFLAGLFLTSITAGGTMAGTVYRPGFLALAVFALTPFGLYLMITMDGVQRIYGGFILFFLTFCFATNKNASRKTRDALAAKLTSRKAEIELEKFAEAAKSHRAATRSVQAIRHDMAQPLLALRNFLAEMDRQATSPEQAVLVRQIRLALISQEALVEELTALEKPASAPLLGRIDAAEMLGQLESEFQPQFATQGCKLGVECGVRTLTSDRARLERILRNFLSNAVKYGATGGQVALRAVSSSGETVWSVEDQGPGMEAGRLHALQGGGQAAPTSKGSGLGLGISRRLAGDLGGRIEIASAPGQGTRVALHLPDADQPALVQQVFVLCVGQEELPGLGGWGDLVSTWMWTFAQAGTCEEARGLISALRLTPDLIVLDQPADQCGPADEIADLAISAPVIHISRQPPETAPPHTGGTIPLPQSETQLRRALEGFVQNNASSRAL